MRWVLATAIGVAVAGCQSSPVPPVAAPTIAPPTVLAQPITDPTTRPIVTGVISVTGDVRHPGPRDLHGSPKLGDLLAKESLVAPATKPTVMLIRRCPEGTTNEVIDLKPDLTVVDPLRNYDLRDGDQLIVSTSPTDLPQPQQPLMSAMPPAH